jgi:hypothetical protein
MARMKEGKKEGRKIRRKEGRKTRRKEGRKLSIVSARRACHPYSCTLQRIH